MRTRPENSITILAPCATFRLHWPRGNTPGWCVEYAALRPLCRQRKLHPTAEEPGYRRKTRRLRRPPSERWRKGVAALDSTLNQTKAGALRGPACGASRLADRVPGEGWGRDRGGCWWRIICLGYIPTRGLQEGELEVGGRAEGGGMRLGGEEGRGGIEGGGAVGGCGNRSSGIDGTVIGGYLECEEAEYEGDEQEEAEKCGGEGEAGEMGDGDVD